VSIEWRGASTRMAYDQNLQNLQGALPDSPRIFTLACCIAFCITLQSPIDRTTSSAVAKKTPIERRQVSPTMPEPAGNGGRPAASGGSGWRGPPWAQFWHSAVGLPAPEEADGADTLPKSTPSKRGDKGGGAGGGGGGSE
jgi:hypothetical protein